MSDPRIVEIRRLYDTADALAREVGDCRAEVQIPAINELRYAGCHILNAINDDGSVNDDELDKAKSHCQRAMYEAAEAGIMYCADEIKAFSRTFSDLVISEVVTDYHRMLARAQHAVDFVVRGRSERTSVEEHVEAYMREFRELLEIVQVFDASRDDLNAKRARQVVEYRRFVIRSLLILLGIVITVVMGLVFVP